jgi:hypothetical protein
MKFFLRIFNHLHKIFDYDHGRRKVNFSGEAIKRKIPRAAAQVHITNQVSIK